MINFSQNKNCFIYPNESVDKLTVNRVFKNINDKINSTTPHNPTDTTETADDKTETADDKTATCEKYGYAKRNEVAFLYEEPSDEIKKDIYSNYYLSIKTYEDYVKNVNTSTDSYLYDIGGGTDATKVSIRLSNSSIDTLVLPNGLNLYTLSFDLGVNDIYNVFKIVNNTSDMVDTTIPIEVEDYINQLYFTDGDISRLDSSYPNIIKKSVEKIITDKNKTGDIEGFTKKLKEHATKELKNNLRFGAVTQLRYNKCNYSTYSSFKKSYIEIVYSFSISLKSILKEKEYKIDKVYDSTPSSPYLQHTPSHRKIDIFKEKPILIPQISLYTNNSRPKPIVGATIKIQHDNNYVDTYELYDDSLTVSQSSLTENTNDENSPSISPTIIIKKYETKYDKNGNIDDNIIYLDASIKFMAGSAYDPHLIASLIHTNILAKIQLVMIGL